MMDNKDLSYSWDQQRFDARIEQRQRDDGSIEYVEILTDSNGMQHEHPLMPGQEPRDERISRLESELWVTKRQLHDAQKDMERLACIVNELQEHILNEIRYVSYEITDTRDKVNEHTKAFHASLIIGNKEGKNESNIP